MEVEHNLAVLEAMILSAKRYERFSWIQVPKIVVIFVFSFLGFFYNQILDSEIKASETILESSGQFQAMQKIPRVIYIHSTMIIPLCHCWYGTFRSRLGIRR